MIFSLLNKGMSKLSDDAARQCVEEICNRLSEEGFDFSQDSSDVKKVVREEFYKEHNTTSISRPKLLGIIAKVTDKYIVQPEKSNEKSSEEPPKQEIVSGTTPNRPKRQMQRSIVDDIVEGEKKHDVNLRKNTTIKTKSHVEFSASKLEGMNIKVGDNEYEVDPKISAPKEFCEDYKELGEAEQNLIELIVGSEASNNYVEAVNKYISDVQTLRRKYPVKSDKKIQKFTFVKKSSKVKFLNPDNSYKVDFLPEDDAEPIVEFNRELTKFEKDWKKGISTEAFNALEYLKLDVIRTQNIIKFEKLSEHYPSIFAENTSKITNTFLSMDENDNFVNIGGDAMAKIIVDKFAPDYMQLFSDLKKFNGTQFQRVVKNIYMHRSGIVLHPKCTPEFKKKRWLQAYANINAVNTSNLEHEKEKSVIEAWKNILSSEFAFYIIMFCIPESSLFNKAFIELIQEGTTIKLLESVLYPISFAFTPFMLGHSNFTLPKQLVNMSETTYKKELSKIFLDFGSPIMKLYDYDECLWLYYADKDGSGNIMIDLLHNVVKNISIEKKVIKRKGLKNSGQTDEENDDDEEEDEN